MAYTLDDIKRIRNSRGGASAPSSSSVSKDKYTLDDIKRIGGRNATKSIDPKDNPSVWTKETSTKASSSNGTIEHKTYSSMDEYNKAIEQYKPENMLAYDTKGIANSLAQGAATALNFLTTPTRPIFGAKAFTADQLTPDNLKFTNSEREYEQLLKDRELFSRADTYNKYMDSVNDEDFDKYASQGAPKGYLQGMENASPLYVVGTDEDRGDIGMIAKDVLGSGRRGKTYSLMTDEEKNIGNYYYNKYGSTAFADYLDDMENVVSSRDYYKKLNATKEIAKSDGAASALLTAKTVGEAIPSSIEAGADYLKRSALGENYNPYNNANMNMDIRGAIAENIAEESPDAPKVFGQNLNSFLYQTGLSTADSLVGAATLGGYFTTAMGASSFNNAYKELYEAGASKEQATIGALAQGTAEAAFEYISLDQLLKPKDILSWKDLFKQSAIQAGVEGSEELFTELANIMSDSLINKAGSDWQKQFYDMKNQGYTDDQIKEVIYENFNNQLWGAALGGALSGGVSTVGWNGMSFAHDSYAGKNIDRALLSDVASQAGYNTEANKRYVELSNKYGSNLIDATNAEVYDLYLKTLDAQNTANSIRKASQYDNSEDEGFKSFKDIFTSKYGETTPSGPKTLNFDTSNDGFTSFKETYENEYGKREAKELFDKKETLDRGTLNTLKLGAAIKSDSEIKTENAMASLNVGETTSVKGKKDADVIRMIKKGSTYYVETSKGLARAEEVTTTKDMAHILSSSVNMDEDTAKAYVAGYNGQDVEGYNLYATYAFNAGYQGDNALSENKEAMQFLGAETANALYQAGVEAKGKERKASTDNAEKVIKKYKGDFHAGKFESDVDIRQLNGTKLRLYNFIKGWSVIGGLNIKVINDFSENSENGEYSTELISIDEGGQITINLAARDNEIDFSSNRFKSKVIIRTFSHELCHSLEDQAPQVWESLKDSVFAALEEENIDIEDAIDAKMKAYEEAGKSINRDGAIREIVANACEDMLSDTSTMDKILSRMSTEDVKGFRKVLNKLFKSIYDLIDSLMAGEGYSNKYSRAIRNHMEEIQNKFADGIAASLLARQGLADSEVVAKILESYNTRASEAMVGGEMYTETEAKEAKKEIEFGLKANNRLAKAAEEKNRQVIEKNGTQYVRYTVDPRVLEDAKRVRAEVADALKAVEHLLPLDIEGDIVVGNASYNKSVEHALICVRSLVNNWFTDKVSEEIGRPLTVEEQIIVSEVLAGQVGDQRECLYCYVAADRKSYRAMFGNYFDMYDKTRRAAAANKAEYKKEYDILTQNMEAYFKAEACLDGKGKVKDGMQEEYDKYSKNAITQSFKGRRKNNGSVTNTKSNPYKGDLKNFVEFMAGRKITPNMMDRYIHFVEEGINGRNSLTAKDLTTEEKRQRIAKADDSRAWFVKDATAYSKSAAWPKNTSRDVKVGDDVMKLEYVAYNGSILNFSPELVKTLNDDFGLRMYSDSDYVPAFLLEDMQVVTDAAVMGLKMLSYTKDIGFVKTFAPTGMAINISTYGVMDTSYLKHEAELSKMRKEAKKSPEAKAAYLAEVEKYVMSDAMQGAEWSEVKALRDKYAYLGNVGSVFVATNDFLVDWALAQDWIDVVIPYHLVRAGAEVADWWDFKNYKGQQEDKKKTSWKAENKARIDRGEEGLLKAIPPTVHWNDKARYIQALKDNHLTPRFKEWFDDENYMKLVNETRIPYNKLNPVQPIFDEAAIASELERLKSEGTYGLAQGVETMDEQERLFNDKFLEAVAELKSFSETGAVSDQYKKTVDKAKGMYDVQVENRNTKKGKTRNSLKNKEALDLASEYVDLASEYDDYNTLDETDYIPDNMISDIAYNIQDGKTTEYIDALQGVIDNDDRDDIIEKAQALLNKFKKTTRYSVKQRDTEYMLAVQSGDMETAQRLVDEAAAEAGYNVKAYHGTSAGGFTVFRTDTIDNNMGSHFGSKEIAEGFASGWWNGGYGRNVEKGQIYSVYLKAQNPYQTYDWFGQDDFYPAYEAVDLAEQIGTKEALAIAEEIKALDPEIAEFIESGDLQEGYLGEKEREVLYSGLRKLLDLGGYDSIEYENGLEIVGDDDYIIQHPEQIKSADPVTYDDDGNVIPLSERFNSENKDIRYSVKSSKIRKNTENHGDVQDYKYAIAEIRKSGHTAITTYEYEQAKRYIKADVRWHKEHNESLDYSSVCVTDSHFVLFESFDDVNPQILDAVKTKEVIRSARRDVWLDDYINKIIAKKRPFGDSDREDVKKFARAIGSNAFDRIMQRPSRDDRGPAPGSASTVPRYSLKSDNSIVDVGNGKIALTDETIEKLFRLYANSSQDYTKAYIAYIDPFDYLKLTTGKYMRGLEDIKKWNTDDYGDFSFEELREGYKDYPMWLTLDDGEANVIGHEGRHRMQKLMELGFDKVPVILVNESNKYDKVSKSLFDVNPQVFDDIDKHNWANQVDFLDVVPLNRKNEGIIRKKFGTDNLAYRVKSTTTAFSIKRNDTADVTRTREYIENQNAKLKEDVKVLKELIKKDKTLTRGKVWNPMQLDGIAQRLIGQTNSTIERSDLRNLLASTYQYINDSLSQTTMEGEIEDWDAIMSRCLDTATQIYELSKNKPTLTRKQLAQEIKNSNVEGRLDDDIFSTLQESITEAVREDYVYKLAVDVYNGFWRASKLDSTSDKLARAHKEKIEAVKKQKIEDKIKYGKIIEELKQNRDQRIKDLKEYQKAKQKQHKLDSERRATIVKITDKATKLAKQLLQNDPKKNPVPQPLKEPLAKLLTAIDYSSQTLLGLRNPNAGQPTQKDLAIGLLMNKVSQQLSSINQDMAEDGEAYSMAMLDLPPSFADEMQKLANAILEVEQSYEGGTDFQRNNVLQYMTLEQLKSLNDLLRTFKSVITKANECIGMRNAHSVDHLGAALISSAREIGDAKARNKLAQWAIDFMTDANQTPYYFFQHLGPAGSEMFRFFMDAQDKFIDNEQEIEDFASETFKRDEMKKWQETVHEFNIIEAPSDEEIAAGKSGRQRKITMTESQIMSFYCTYVREQTTVTNHLGGAGIVIPAIDVKGTRIRQQDAVTLSRDSIAQILEVIENDARMKEVADAIQGFLSGRCSEWGNEVTLKRWGIKSFMEEKYFPFKVNQNVLKTDVKETVKQSIYTLLNMSFTKALTSESSNELVIGDIFTVFTNHAVDMAKYNAWALPILNVIKIWNYAETESRGTEGSYTATTVKGELQKAYGDKANGYIRDLLADLNTDYETGRYDNVGLGLMKNYKTAAVAANMQTALLQPLSYVRAAYMINPKYLTMALTKAPKVKKTQELIAVARWKDKGFYDLDIGRRVEHQILKDDSLKDKLIDWSLKPAEAMDKLTWGVILNAVEAETRDKHKNLIVNSEEFNQVVADRMRDILYGTQVFDSTLSRSSMMRSKSTAVKGYTAFMSEPTVSLNMVMDAVMKFNQDVRKTGNFKTAASRNAKNITRMLAVYTVSSLAESILRGIVGKIRKFDGDDDEFDGLLEDIWGRFLDEMLIFGKIPILKDIVSMLQGYSATNMTTEGIENTIEAGKIGLKIINGDKELTTSNALKMITALGQVTGLPAANLYKELKVIWNHTLGKATDHYIK